MRSLEKEMLKASKKPGTIIAEKGQVLLEFTFCMIIVFLMIYGVTKVFIWTGRDFAGRAIAHDARLVTPVETAYGYFKFENEELVYVSEGEGPLKQLDPYFYTPIKMDAIWNGRE